MAIYIEINLICCAVSLLMLYGFRASNERQAASLAYIRALIATIAVLLLDIAWALTEGRPGPSAIRCNYLINATYLFVSSLIGYFWLQFVLHRLHRNVQRRVAVRLLMAAPLAVLFVACVLSPWTHWLYRITPENVYERGRLIIIYQVINYGYVLTAGVYSLLFALRNSNREKRVEALTLSSFTVLPVLGGTITVFLYGLPILWPFTTVSLLMVYMNLQGLQISTDALTGLNNRRQFDRFLLAQIEDPHRDESLYLLLMDIDDFKKINDTYGHLAGDEALALASGILKQICGIWDCFLARYGGDEFAIVFRARDPVRVERLREDLRDAFARFNRSKTTPYSLTISIGTGIYSTSVNTPVNLIAQADRELYAAKAQKKLDRVRRGGNAGQS